MLADRGGGDLFAPAGASRCGTLRTGRAVDSRTVADLRIAADDEGFRAGRQSVQRAVSAQEGVRRVLLGQFAGGVVALVLLVFQPALPRAGVAVVTFFVALDIAADRSRRLGHTRPLDRHLPGAGRGARQTATFRLGRGQSHQDAPLLAAMVIETGHPDRLAIAVDGKILHEVAVFWSTLSRRFQLHRGACLRRGDRHGDAVHITEGRVEPQFEIARCPVVGLAAPADGEAGVCGLGCAQSVGGDHAMQPAEMHIAGRDDQLRAHLGKAAAALRDQLADRRLELGGAVMRAAGEAVAEVDQQMDPVVSASISPRDPVGALEDVMQGAQDEHLLADPRGVPAGGVRQFNRDDADRLAVGHAVMAGAEPGGEVEHGAAMGCDPARSDGRSWGVVHGAIKRILVAAVSSDQTLDLRTHQLPAEEDRLVPVTARGLQPAEFDTAARHRGSTARRATIGGAEMVVGERDVVVDHRHDHELARFGWKMLSGGPVAVRHLVRRAMHGARGDRQVEPEIRARRGRPGGRLAIR